MNNPINNYGGAKQDYYYQNNKRIDKEKELISKFRNNPSRQQIIYENDNSKYPQNKEYTKNQYVNPFSDPLPQNFHPRMIVPANSNEMQLCYPEKYNEINKAIETQNIHEISDKQNMHKINYCINNKITTNTINAKNVINVNKGDNEVAKFNQNAYHNQNPGNYPQYISFNKNDIHLYNKDAFQEYKTKKIPNIKEQNIQIKSPAIPNQDNTFSPYLNDLNLQRHTSEEQKYPIIKTNFSVFT